MSTRIFKIVSIGLIIAVGTSTCFANEPTPSLDDLLKEYKKLGLPLPPADAKLVRYQVKGGAAYHLGFLLEPETARENALILEGTYQRRCDRKMHPHEVNPEPNLSELPHFYDCLPMALQCHERGWDKLARELLQRAEGDSPGFGMFGGGKIPVQEQLIHGAWYYWSSKITEPKIDRNPAAKRLAEIIKLDKSRDTLDHLAMLKSLDAALVPSKAKPGSVEALIDGLVDYQTPGYGELDEAYLRIARLGFDAVPELIGHLDDERLTRSVEHHFHPFQSRTTWPRVGDIVGKLLTGLAGPSSQDWREGERPSKALVQKWWLEARKQGEEAYMLELARPPGEMGDAWPPPNLTAVSVIAHKYPKKMSMLYREILEKTPDFSGNVAEFVMKAAIPRMEKLELLTLAAKQMDINSGRYSALRYLNDLDKELFVKLLTNAINDLQKEDFGAAHLGALVVLTDDPRPWKALEKAATRVGADLRLGILDLRNSPHSANYGSRRLQFLAAFLDDSAVGALMVCDYSEIEVRNFAALEIAYQLGIEVKFDPERNAADWAKIREQVRESLRKELEKDKK